MNLPTPVALGVTPWTRHESPPLFGVYQLIRTVSLMILPCQDLPESPSATGLWYDCLDVA